MPGRIRTWLRSWRTPARSQHEQADRAAAQGEDPIEAAVSYARHIIARDTPGQEITGAVIIVETGEGQRSRVIYAADDVDSSSVKIRGLLSEALRAHTQLGDRMARQRDIEDFANMVAPQLLEGLDQRLTQNSAGEKPSDQACRVPPPG